ncbi:MAG: AAA family ATPase, partial [Terriglobales bacterium]
MRVHLTIKNYRCFVRPVTIALEPGFTAFVGVNNAGKSAVMRFLLELRPLLALIKDQRQLLHSANNPAGTTGFTPIHVLDKHEIFSNLNNNALEFWLDFPPAGTGGLTRAKFKVTRSFHWTTEFTVGSTAIGNVNPI